VDGRLFCSRDPKSLDQIVDLMNKDPNTGGRITTAPRNVMQVPVDESSVWAGSKADVRGLAIGSDGLVVLHEDGVEAVSLDGRSLWTIPLPTHPVRWGAALTGKQCVVTLTDGNVVCFTKG
jgi:hypothetical protein